MSHLNINRYDARARRRLTINGGAEKVPLPIWRSDKYDVGHKTDSGKKLVNNVIIKEIQLLILLISLC